MRQLASTGMGPTAVRPLFGTTLRLTTVDWQRPTPCSYSSVKWEFQAATWRGHSRHRVGLGCAAAHDLSTQIVPVAG